MEDRYGNVRDKLREKINNDGEFKIDDDVEYYYAIGQLTNYFISLSKASSKKHSDANSILRLSSDQKIRTRLRIPPCNTTRDHLLFLPSATSSHS